MDDEDDDQMILIFYIISRGTVLLIWRTNFSLLLRNLPTFVYRSDNTTACTCSAHNTTACTCSAHNTTACTSSPVPDITRHYSQVFVFIMTSNVVKSASLRSIATSHDDKEGFSSRWAFWLTAFGCAGGYGNIWRFPYLCYKFGGFAFFLPYITGLVLVRIEDVV